MSNMSELDAVQPTLRTCQIIVIALIMGVLFYLAIITLVVPPLFNPAPALRGEGAGEAAIAGPGNSPLVVITYLALAVGLVDLVLSFVLPKLNTDQARRRLAQKGPAESTRGVPSESKQSGPAGDTGKLLSLYQTQLIIGAAMLEGGAFFAAVAYMLDRNPIALVTAIVLLGTMAARFPTSNRLTAWLDRQIGLLHEERQSAS
jgi:hypothetical protein